MVLHRVALGSLLASLLALASAGCGNSDGKPVTPHVATPTPGASPPGVTLDNTAAFHLTSQANGRTYPIWVDVPASYAQHPERRYPVVFVTDGLYSFPLVRSIRNLLGQKGRNIEEFILVGLPPEQGKTSKESRSRDYTPSDPLRDPNADRQEDYSTEHYGEAAAYRDFIQAQVFPLIAREYRADMQRKVFAGHSLGGLFGSFVLLTRPEMFDAYILSSPSLWFDHREILRYEAEYARGHRDLRARVMLYNGMYETKGPPPRYYRTGDMIGDSRAFARLLKSRGYPGLYIDSQVIAEEDHLSVYPATISRGLVWALPGSGPYFSG
jgi:predicted alpha/beta superfamily hydrolase